MVIEVGNGSRHTRKGTWDAGYTALPMTMSKQRRHFVGAAFLFFRPGVGLLNIRQSQQVVDTGVVKERQLFQGHDWDI